jgi:polysaccharide biosynthesis PFTS motif protein
MKIKLFNTTFFYNGVFAFLNKNLIMRILRSSYLLRKENPRFMMKIWEELSETKIIIKENSISKLIYGKHTKNIEIFTRQKIISWLAGFKLNKLLLIFYSYKIKIIFPLPRQFQEVLNFNKFSTNTISSLLLYFYGLLEIFFSFIIFVKIVFFEYRNKKFILKPYVYFDNLEKKNLPINTDDKSEKYDLITWYASWPENEKVDIIKYGPKNYGRLKYDNLFIDYLKYKLPPLGSIKKLLLTVWYFSTLFVSIKSLFTRNWINAFNLSDALILKKTSLLEANYLAKNYLFSYSQYIKRPLWTYEAETKGSKITLYNYAASSGGFKGKFGYPHLDLGISSMTWPRIVTWSQQNTNYLKDNINYKVKFLSSNTPVNFKDEYYDFNAMNKNFICVFDIAPYRKLFRSIWCSEEIIYDFHYTFCFLKDIFDICTKNKINAVWKKKKNDHEFTPSGYKNLTKEIVYNKYVNLVNSDIAASRCIINCKAVISMPFTSTSEIAKFYSKPNIFYDPKNMINDDDRGAGGTLILHNKKELEDWIIATCS